MARLALITTLAVIAASLTGLPATQAVRAAAPASGQLGSLQVGVGRADITPPTGYFTMGNVRSDARATGQHTRLQARAIVLARGERKVALVVTDLCCVAGGLLTEAAKRLRGTGLDETTMVVSGTHTHSAPGQYFPFAAYDVTFPNVHTATAFSVMPDPQLYGFLARRIATAIRRADADLAPGAAAWGHTEIKVGLTQNRSIEAHLANFGIDRELGEGSAAQSPHGRASTIDPDLEVLRVDKRIGGRLVPVGMWSTFANHGTVNLGSRASSYNGDHLGAAMLATEDAVRRVGGTPSGQEVVSAFSNADEGDASSALDRTGPAAAEYVGRVEAAAMMRAWADAGRRLSTIPALDVRWTRFCFCGQQTEGGRVDDKAVPGLPLLSGSDEHRGQLHEHAGVVFEGHRLPVEAGPQGNKIQLEPQGVPIPAGAPLALVRVGNGAIVSNPGEVTVELGRRIKRAVSRALSALPVTTVAISGLANEYQGYFTTPEEYAWQAYEGGQTNFGKYSGNLLVEETARLARSLGQGRPAPAPYPFDPTNGLRADHTPFPTGAAGATAVAQPGSVPRLGRATFSWDGGPRGTDRPLDRAFVTVERRARAGWVRAHDDLGMTIRWEVEGDEAVPLGARYAKEAGTGRYRAFWEVPLDAPTGAYRFVVNAKRYRLTSRSFRVRRGASVAVRPVRARPGRAAFVLAYPSARPYVDLTYRPAASAGGAATVRVAGRTLLVRARPNGTFSFPAPAGSRVVVPRGAARDPFGNPNTRRVAFTAGEPRAARPKEAYPVLR
ncbi:MAG TPA: neutral/alkaline non-lysosomal ceramidase N-terminal domain-containing protein [Nocardioidaceae bacterium]|nr:neutral/alkaline non-lysosomal ceramidase N-terminal domain-containing protein [Nocardioidaceae bacterium]